MSRLLLITGRSYSAKGKPLANTLEPNLHTSVSELTQAPAHEATKVIDQAQSQELDIDGQEPMPVFGQTHTTSTVSTTPTTWTHTVTNKPLIDNIPIPWG